MPRAVTSSGKPQEPSKFGGGTREVASAKAGNKGYSAPEGKGPMNIRIPAHPDKSKVR